MVENKTTDHLRRLWQHVYLDVAAGLLILFECFNALFHLRIDKFQLFANAAVLFYEPRPLQTVIDGMFEYCAVDEWQREVVADTQTQRT